MYPDLFAFLQQRYGDTVGDEPRLGEQRSAIGMASQKLGINLDRLLRKLARPRA